MNHSTIFAIPSALLLSFFFLALPANATTSDSFQVNQVLGDGKNGNTWSQWSQPVNNGTITVVRAEVKRVKGGNDTFINLRFGSGQAFGNGKQTFLTHDKYQTVRWNVNQSGNGKPLVMNAYNGEVLLRNVVVVYADSLQGSRGSDGRYDDREHDSRRHDGRRYDDRHSGSLSGKVRDDDYRGSQGRVPRSCRRGDYRAPRIEVGKVKSSGGLFSGKYRIRGSIEGSCVEEAGYFEEGRLKERFQIPLSDRFQRQEFNIKVRSGRNGEIRVYSSDGRDDRVYVDDLIQKNSGKSPF